MSMTATTRVTGETGFAEAVFAFVARFLVTEDFKLAMPERVASKKRPGLLPLFRFYPISPYRVKTSLASSPPKQASARQP